MISTIFRGLFFREPEQAPSKQKKQRSSLDALKAELDNLKAANARLECTEPVDLNDLLTRLDRVKTDGHNALQPTGTND